MNLKRVTRWKRHGFCSIGGTINEPPQIGALPQDRSPHLSIIQSLIQRDGVLEHAALYQRENDDLRVSIMPKLFFSRYYLGTVRFELFREALKHFLPQERVRIARGRLRVGPGNRNQEGCECRGRNAVKCDEFAQNTGVNLWSNLTDAIDNFFTSEIGLRELICNLNGKELDFWIIA
jgi:hypothetical protein